MSNTDFPNNWAKYAAAPASLFQSITWEEFHDWKLCSWDLPDSVACIVRCENKDTGKIKEWSYQQGHAAERRIFKLMEDPSNVVTVCDDQEIHLITAEYPTDDNA